MIYKIIVIDGDNGISLLEATFKSFNKLLNNDTIPAFFNIINKTIDNIQEAMSKGRRPNEMLRVLESEDSIFIVYYHPLSRVLFCSISDADDDINKIKKTLNKISNRFWKKHKSDLKTYRTTSEKNRFQTFITDIENLSLGGRVAEIFPKLQIVKNVLEKILSMGLVSKFDLQVALNCTGNNSPLKIARNLNRNRKEIEDVLKKLMQLDIIK